MLFFRKATDDQNKKNVTLQVRIPYAKKSFPVKRALSSALFQTKKASLTVEAAMVLPLFLFSMVILMTPMKLMDEARRIQFSLDRAGQEISQYAYIMYQLGQGENKEGYETPELAGELAGILEKEGVLIYVRHKMDKQINLSRLKSVSFRRSSILADGETIDLIMDYRMKLPFSVFGLDSVPMTARSFRRAWIGMEGKAKNGEGKDGNQEDELVYVGRDSTRYHKSSTCHYLYNNISQVSLEEVTAMRNSSGAKYKPCSRCGRYANTGGSVYIMPGGEHYHSDRDCSSITAYVQAVPLSQVSYLGPCTYCSK